MAGFKVTLRDGKEFSTYLPETVRFCEENFPYLIHLEVKNPKTGLYENVKASKVLPLLQVGNFDDSQYRLGDPRRARALFHLPELLSDPDYIFRNSRHGAKRNCGDLRGEHIYVEQDRQSKKQVKIGLTLFDERLQISVLVSSFFTNWNWLQKCVGDCVYDKQKRKEK